MSSTVLLAAFNWYGFLIAFGVAICSVLAYFISRKRGLDGDSVMDIAIWAVPLAVIGARLYYVLFDALDGNSWTFLEILGFTDEGYKLEGLAIYGAVLFSILGIFFCSLVYKKKGKNVTFLQLLDVGAPFLILGQAIGRWGNFANQEAFGNPVTNPAFQWFPYAVYIENLKGYFQATFFYESLWNLIGFAVLLWLYIGKRRSFNGFIAAMYGIWYGLGRVIIEGLRSDSLMLGNARISQVVSIIGMAIGIVGILYIIYRARVQSRKIPIFVKYEDWPDTGLPLSAYGPKYGTVSAIPQFLRRKPSTSDAGKVYKDEGKTDESDKREE